MKNVIFIKNAAVLTVTSFILRFAGIIFKVRVAALIGSEGLGLYSLVLSVYFLISTFASQGICTAVTRIATECFANGNKKGALSALRRGILLSILLSAVSAGAVYFGADIIAVRFLSDERLIGSVKIIGFSLPFMSISSCIRGYFIARRKTVSSSVAQIIEQTVRIATVLILLTGERAKNLKNACKFLVLGDCIAEGVACLFLCLCLFYDIKNLKGFAKTEKIKTKSSITRIAAPLTAGRYLNNLLRTTENILVPKALIKHGLSASLALSLFGVIKGMALPILFFPSSLLNAVSLLLIPEMTEALGLGRRVKIKYAAERVIKTTSIIGILLGGLFLRLADTLGVLIYGNGDVGFVLRVLAPLVPLMYLDSICDGMLKGLDEQKFVFYVTVTDSAVRLLFVFPVVTMLGLRGFLIIMVASNLYTSIVRVIKLKKVSNAEISITKTAILPTVSVIIALALCEALLRTVSLGALWYTAAYCAATSVIYGVLCILLGIVSREELLFFRK